MPLETAGISNIYRARQPREANWPVRGPRKAITATALYALCFWVTHATAARWGGAGYYSVFYPAAGLRIAFLWHLGAGWCYFLAAVELAVDLISGIVVFDRVDGWIAVLAILRPSLSYGAAIWLVRRLTHDTRATAFSPPMPFAVAGVTAPFLTMLATLPQSVLRGDLTGVAASQDIVLSMSAFFVGDLLGVLIIAPPLLWFLDHLETEKGGPQLPSSAVTILEAGAILTAGASTSALLAHLGLGPQPAPALMAVAWIGLRFGRATAWVALVMLCALVLPYTAGLKLTNERLQFHLGLASVVMAGYLAGSFRDAQLSARRDVERRDKLLFQAERLKTLRAMSVAVIHEVSQPLSTLAIEARHLHEITVDAPTEIATTAALIDRKAAHLSELVRRLRRYGGRAVDQPSPLPLSLLIDNVMLLSRHEILASNIAMTVEPIDTDLVILAQEVELAQAIHNLIRNAAQACDGKGAVTIATARNGDTAEVSVMNPVRSGVASRKGMGVGTFVARAIIEAHGGVLIRQEFEGVVTAIVTLPLVRPDE